MSTISDNNEKSNLIETKLPLSKYKISSAIAVFLFPALGGLLFGYDIGATSSAIIQIQSSQYSGVLWWQTIKYSSLLQGIIASISMLGAMIGCLICFKVADQLGRRKTILISCYFYFAGSIVEFVSGYSYWPASIGVSVLIIGRLIYGVGCGFAMQGAPAYIGEMAPFQIRGVLISLKEAFIVLGMLLGYSIGYAFSEVVCGWTITYGITSILAMIMFVGMYFLPDSARWLALRNKTKESLSALRFVTPELSYVEITAITDLATKATSYNQKSTLYEDWIKVTSPNIFPAMIAGVGLVVFQQITGQPSVLFYANTIFNDIGVSSIAAIAISLFKLVATLLATFTVDKYGRKLLLYIGCTLMLAALIALTIAFIYPYSNAEECNQYNSVDSCPVSCLWNSNNIQSCDVCITDCISTCCGTTSMNTQKVIIILSLFIYIGGYQVGFGPVSWLVVSEIFPLEIRSKAVSIAVVTNFILNFIVSFIFPIELEYIGTSNTFLIYALILLLGLYFISKCVPETKGLTLEEIEEFFMKTSKINHPSNIIVSNNMNNNINNNIGRKYITFYNSNDIEKCANDMSNIKKNDRRHINSDSDNENNNNDDSNSIESYLDKLDNHTILSEESLRLLPTL